MVKEMIRLYCRFAFDMLIQSRLRSWLTILGIVVGVSSVVCILSLGDMMENTVETHLEDLGADIIEIRPGFQRGEGIFSYIATTDTDAELTEKDMLALRSVSEVEHADKNILSHAKVYFVGEKAKVLIIGVDENTWKYVTTTNVVEGRTLGPSDKNVAVIGQAVAQEYFDKPIGINQRITIEGNPFRVQGVVSGNRFDNADHSIFLPLDDAFRVLFWMKTDVYDKIVVRPDENSDSEVVIEKMTRTLQNSRHVNEINQDFTVASSEQMRQTISQAVNMIKTFLAIIALVAIVIGAIGIANTMFTSVLERTSEIGVVKAVGARNIDILIIFLLKSMLMGLVGGIAGLALGYLLTSVLLKVFIENFTLVSLATTIISLKVLVYSLVLAIATGGVAGFLPAYNASRLQPVDALRYE